MKKPLLIASLVLAIALQGCVYLRLLEVKRQLSDYPENFSADTSDGLRLNFLKPALLEKDLEFIGLFPNAIELSELNRTWKIVFEKNYNDGQVETENYDILVEMDLDKQDKLVSIHLNDRYFAFFTKEQFLSILRSFGGASINVKKREAFAQMEEGDQPDQAPPTRPELIKQLGIPFLTTEENTLEYRYLQKHPSEELPDGGISQKADYYKALFHFDNQDRLTQVSGTFPFIGSITVGFQYDPET